MAVKHKFTCSCKDNDFITVDRGIGNNSENIMIGGSFEFLDLDFVLDINTAVKLCKTLSSEIRKVKEGGQNGN